MNQLDSDQVLLPATKYAKELSSGRSLYHPLTTTLRSFIAFLFTLIIAPFTAPAFSLKLPSCLLTRLLERFAVHLLYFITTIAGVEVDIHPRSSVTNNEPYPYHYLWLPAPLIRSWTSPLSSNRYVRTYDQPGRWMNDEQLQALHETLKQVGIESIGSLPTHRLFEQDTIRQALSNRIISVAYDAQGAVGFTAMVYLNIPNDLIVHLGLTMIGKRGRGKRLQSALFTKSLLLPIFNLCRFQYTITNCAASPAGIGSVSDYFFDTYPSYDCSTTRKEYHVRSATYILSHYRYEFGASKNATFDTVSFVLHCSNEAQGGGTHQFIRCDDSPISQYKDEKCNQFVASLLSLSQGDELFQVGTFYALGTIYLFILMKFKKRNRKVIVT